jgi:TRAP-type C4-dicarboxylate transport system permease small subunit
VKVRNVTLSVWSFEATLRKIANWLSVGAGIILIIMMMFDVTDVVSRYFFLKPLKGTWETVALLLVIAGTWGMARSEFEDLHLRVDLITRKFPKILQKVLDLFAHLIASFMLGLIAWNMFFLGINQMVNGTTMKTAEFGVPYAPFMIFFGIGLLFFFLSILFHLVRIARSFKEG